MTLPARRATLRDMLYDLDALPKSLITRENAKTTKGEASGYLTGIMYLAPAMLSGRNVCPHATDACAAACLNTAGQGGMGARMDDNGVSLIQAVRIQRARWLQRDRKGFFATLVAEIEAHARYARAHGMIPCIRLNGTSDLPWERWRVVRDGVLHSHIFAAFPDIQFYDYTKWPPGTRLVGMIPNYHLTFSLSEANDAQAFDAARAGYNVAVVFDTPKGRALPDTLELSNGELSIELSIIDGDKTDLRFLDRDAPCIVGLRAKGKARHDTTGFVRKVTA